MQFDRNHRCFRLQSAVYSRVEIVDTLQEVTYGVL